MPSRPIYEPVEFTDKETPPSSPRQGYRDGDGDLGTPEQKQYRTESPRPRISPSNSFTPPLGTFSSAQAYASLGNDEPHMTRSPSSRPFLASSMSNYSSRPMSRTSSHFLANDYDSVHQLGKFGEANAIPMQNYSDKEARSLLSTPTPQDYDSARAAGIAKYGLGADASKKRAMSTRKKWSIFAAVVIVLVVIAVAIAVPLLKVQHDQNPAETTETSAGEGTGPHGTVLTSGGNGTTIKMDNGTEFLYVNNFGGQWRSGLTDDGAQAQNYTPRLNETWDYARNRMLGVNLGGWLVVEPFIVPSLFEPYENQTANLATPVVDEYTLMQQWRSEGGSALATSNIQRHYDTFITEKDFAEIAAAGLNWIRLPIGYWAITKMDNEPFVEGLSWTYFLKAVQWARKYGLRIELDLHAIPGSQNGYNHGGRLGVFNFLNSPAGFVSAERTLNVIRTMTEFISQPAIANVVPAFGVLNEPNVPIGIGLENIRRFYAETYSTVRNVSGTGAGKGPMIFLHDGFMGLGSYSGFLQGGDRVGWDLHPYICFPQAGPFGDRTSLPIAACNTFQGNADLAFQQYGVTMAGEFSLANNDCGLFLNGPFQGVRYDGSFSSGAWPNQGSCVPFDDWPNFDAATKTTMMDGAIAQMASFQNFFFWTWKIGDSLRTGRPVNPNWSYQLGLEQGWMPTDPYTAMQGACGRMQQKYPGIAKTAFDWSGRFADFQTGSAQSYAPNTTGFEWPPVSMASSGLASSIPATAIPSYTATAPHLTAAVPAPTISVKNEASPSWNPWVPAQFTQPAFTAIAGCDYFPDMFANVTSVPSGWPCSGSATRKRHWLDFDDLTPMDRRQPQPQPQPTRMPEWQ